jgi:hypothetical protein
MSETIADELSYLNRRAEEGGYVGESARQALLKYSEDEERDDHGRFAGGGGTANSSREDVSSRLEGTARLFATRQSGNGAQRIAMSGKADGLRQAADMIRGGAQQSHLEEERQASLSEMTRIGSKRSGDLTDEWAYHNGRQSGFQDAQTAMSEAGLSEYA